MIGQINRGSKLGDIIYDMCSQSDVKTIVEIGTWNGMGTTKCIYDAIIDSKKDDYLVYSIENNIEMYNKAINNLPKLKDFNLLLGTIVNKSELLVLEECDDMFFKQYSRQEQSKWLYDDMNGSSKNVLSILPEQIDLLILDGGEFGGLVEFNKLGSRASYIILDDTSVLKNYEVANILRQDNNFQILMDFPNERNGFLISKKLK